MSLPVNFVDDILDSSMNGKRRYRMNQNADGTISFDDETTYTQNGSAFGAAQINATNAAVNALSIYLGPFTLSAGIQTYTITDARILANSAIDALWANGDEEVVSNAGRHWTQTAGSATVTFDNALESAVTLEWFHIVNPT